LFSWFNDFSELVSSTSNNFDVFTDACAVYISYSYAERAEDIEIRQNLKYLGNISFIIL